MNKSGSSQDYCAVSVHTALRIAAAQYPRKSPEDQAIERRYMARDLAAVEARPSVTA